MTGVPGPPSKPVVTHVTCRSCLLTWSAPLIDGGKPIFEYRIQLRTRKSCGWTRAARLTANETQYLMTRLKPGTLYQFRIAAVNEFGSGTGGPESDYFEAAGIILQGNRCIYFFLYYLLKCLLPL